MKRCRECKKIIWPWQGWARTKSYRGPTWHPTVQQWHLKCPRGAA